MFVLLSKLYHEDKMSFHSRGQRGVGTGLTKIPAVLMGSGYLPRTPWSFDWLLGCLLALKGESDYVAQAGLQLKALCLSFPITEIAGVHHKSALDRYRPFFLNVVSMNCLFLCQI